MPPADPIALFGELFARARDAGIDNANAMHLATADAEGRPSVRVVLLKGFDASGFVFYTNLDSRKGLELAANPRAELNFYWRELARQVRIGGEVARVSDAEADAYWASRPRLSQLGAWASKQSRPLPSKARLVADVAKAESRHLGRPVPRPPFWGGFRLRPERLEFWHSKPFRLHDRLEYRRTADGWQATTLYP
jgi:pyridoxamine 5'-phosphate oxidase